MATTRLLPAVLGRSPTVVRWLVRPREPCSYADRCERGRRRPQRAGTRARQRNDELDERIAELAQRRHKLEAQLREGRGSSVEQLRVARDNVDRARRAAETVATAEESSAVVHDRSALVHEQLADAAVGDVEEHRRRAAEHRRAADLDRKAAEYDRTEADRRRRLSWSDIDADGAGLRVRQTIVSVTRTQVTPEQAACPVCGQVHVGRLFKAPKSRKGRRWVPLAAPAQDALARHCEGQRDDREFFGTDYRDHGLVFCRPDGIPLRPDRVTVEFEKHVAACGLPVVRLHDTRHGACSLMLAGGVPIEIVQLILGHSSPEVTRRVYAHLMRATTAAQVEKAVELLTRHRPDRRPAVSNP